MTESNGGRPSGRPRLLQGVSEAEIRRTVELHAQGLNDREVGEQLGLGAAAARGRRVALGLPANGYRLYSDAERDRLRLLLAGGRSLTEAANILGRDPASVRYFAKREGMNYTPSKGREHPRVQSEDVAEIVSVARRSRTITDVARELGLSAGKVKRILEQQAPWLLAYGDDRGLVGPNLAEHVRNTAGTATKSVGHIDYIAAGQNYPAEFVEDYGPEEIGRWVDRLDADLVALRQLRNRLAGAVTAATLRQTD